MMSKSESEEMKGKYRLMILLNLIFHDYYTICVLCVKSYLTYIDSMNISNRNSKELYNILSYFKFSAKTQIIFRTN